MPGLVPGLALARQKAWMAGLSPAMPVLEEAENQNAQTRLAELPFQRYSLCPYAPIV
jgi:hypothetical protein